MLYSTTTAAKEIGCHRESVRRIAIFNGIGSQLPTGLAFTADDLAKIRAKLQPVGRPKVKKSAAKRR